MFRFISFSAMSFALLLVGCAPANELSEQTALDATQSVTQQTSELKITNDLSGLSLTNSLMQQLGINEQQAMGGVGSIFALAQQRMKPGEFIQLISRVPDLDQYLSAVPQPTNSSSVSFGSSADLLGEQDSSLGSLTNLAGSFQALGMDNALINRFVPVVLKYVQEQSGAGTMSLLQNALY